MFQVRIPPGGVQDFGRETAQSIAARSPPKIEPFAPLPIPLLSDLPLIGPALFAQTALTYLAAMIGSVFGGSLSDRFGRTAITLLMSLASLVCSFSFGWMIGLPMFLLVAVAVFYNLTGVADSSIHSTTLTELIDPRYLGAAYSLRSVLGFGAGAIAPWVFGLVLDWGRAGAGLPAHVVWGLAWSTLGLGGLLGPVVIWRLRRMPEAAKLAGGKR